jgi:hypothetical protein
MLVFIMQVYHDAQSTECEISNPCVVFYIYIYGDTTVNLANVWSMQCRYVYVFACTFLKASATNISRNQMYHFYRYTEAV